MLQRIKVDSAKLKASYRQARTATKAERKALLRQCQYVEDVPAAECELVETVVYPALQASEVRDFLLGIKMATAVPTSIGMLSDDQLKRAMMPFSIRVYKRLDTDARQCFQSVILLFGKPIKQLFFQSPSAYVSREHFAKRAINTFILTGEWPKKLGITLPTR